MATGPFRPQHRLDDRDPATTGDLLAEGLRLGRCSPTTIGAKHQDEPLDEQHDGCGIDGEQHERHPNAHHPKAAIARQMTSPQPRRMKRRFGIDRWPVLGTIVEVSSDTYTSWRENRTLRLGAGLAFYALYTIVPFLPRSLWRSPSNSSA